MAGAPVFMSIRGALYYLTKGAKMERTSLYMQNRLAICRAMGKKEARLFTMSYKEDLKILRSWLGRREMGHVKAAANTHDKREENKKKAAAVARVLRWQRKHRAVYRHRMKMYMRRRKATLLAAA